MYSVTHPGVCATGAGETAITVAPSAIGNAIFDATGARLLDLPFTPGRVTAALSRRERTGERHENGSPMLLRWLAAPSCFVLCFGDQGHRSNRRREVSCAAALAKRCVGRCLQGCCYRALASSLHELPLNWRFPASGDDTNQYTMQVRQGPHSEGVNAVKAQHLPSGSQSSRLARTSRRAGFGVFLLPIR